MSNKVLDQKPLNSNKETKTKFKPNPTKLKKLKLTEHDQIVGAFHNKYKIEERKKWVLKEDDFPEVIAEVNKSSFEDQVTMG